MTIAIDATDIIDAIADSTRKNTQHKSSFYPTLGSNLPSFSKRNTRIKNSNIYSKLPLIEKKREGKLYTYFPLPKNGHQINQKPFVVFIEFGRVLEGICIAFLLPARRGISYFFQRNFG